MAIRDKFDNIYYKKDRGKILEFIEKVNKRFNLIRNKDADLISETNRLREKLRNGEKIENIIPDALAVCKEAVRVATGYKIPYDVQTEAAIAMMENGTIVEMQTGEGKTMVQILSSYLSALEATKSLDKSEWGSVHVLTSNDYLAQENANQNKKVFELLGLSCSYSDRSLSVNEKKDAYLCDVVYSTATNVAFDMLEDQNVRNKNDKYLKRKLFKAIVDEADDVLIDQALNPLILTDSTFSVSDKEMIENLIWANRFVEGEIIRKADGSLDPVECYVEETKDNPPMIYDEKSGKSRKAVLTEAKITRSDMTVTITDRLSDYIHDATRREMPEKNENELMRMSFLREYCIQEILKAKYLFKKDKNYSITNIKTKDVIKNPSEEVDACVTLIDENTGVFMFDSKYAGYTQAALEIIEDYKAKNNSNCKYRVPISKRPSIIGKNSYPNLIKSYENFSGMTGTSNNESFREIYGFNTYRIPTRKPSIRVDREDEIYATKKQKYQAILKEVIRCSETFQPVLIGTTSIEESKEISKLLKESGILHNLLNAENYKESGDIIKTAGQLGSVTVATNMAGRGVDIQLGEGVKELGGLYVIGTSKNKSERIDRQLRGRAARQGDPGCSKFFQSAEDDLVLYNANRKEYEKIQELARSCVDEVQTGHITNKGIIKIINNYQNRQESNDLGRRKMAEEFNAPFADVMNMFFKYRDKLLNAEKPVEIDVVIKETVSKLAYFISNGVGFGLAHSEFDRNQAATLLASIGANINVDEVYDSNPNKFEEKLANALISRVDKSSNNQAKIKSKMLSTADEIWSIFLESEQEILSSFTLGQYGGTNSGAAEEYRRELMNQYSMYSFNILLEQSAYIFNPSLEFGKYIVPDESIQKEKGVTL